jgi:hypothetical protein
MCWEKRNPTTTGNKEKRGFATLVVQEIRTPDGVAGYTDLLDKQGVSVLHPNPEVEGKNFILWQKDFRRCGTW